MNDTIYLDNKDSVTRTMQDVTMTFAGKRKVLSTSILNGGIRTDLKGAFNHCDKDRESGRCDMHGDTYREHLSYAATQLGYDAKTVTGLSTAAMMEYADFRKASFGGYTVTVVVTGGVYSNGRRAGETATMWEQDEVYHVIEGEGRTSGTVNLMVHINAHLSDGALATVMMVATEAKTATIRDLQIKSCYSEELSSGSGTDGIIVVSDEESDIYLTAAGTDTKLGECVARAVTEALREQLVMQKQYIRGELDIKEISW
ncbi:MAG: adenosylcobinamide amidohydrolase [Eubacterium sp.]|nr:adenosylcobinamide amidohydrolase [Eubacterium sp.]